MTTISLFRGIAAAGAVGVLAACSFRPIPLAAAPGSTITIALNAEDTLALGGHVVGYEGSIFRDQGQYDDLRGELVFALTNSSTSYPMNTRLLTRVQPDPATLAGIENDVYANPLLSFQGITQIVVVLDVPFAAAPGVYNISISRRRRTGPDTYETFPSGIPYAAQLQVLATAPVSPTPHMANNDSLVPDRLFPHPKLVLALPADPKPAAARIAIQYPPGVTPLSAFEEQHLGRGSMVRWSDDPATHTVTIQHVDPDAAVGRLSLAFRMPDGPLDASELPGLEDFAVLSESYYDSSGLPMTGVSATKTGIR